MTAQPHRPGGNGGRGEPADAGFTLVEMVVAMALLMTSLVMGVVSGESNVLTMLRNLNLSSQENLIEEDLARIRRLAEDYTWCSGRGTVGRPLGSGSCASDASLSSRFYFPDFPPDPDEPDTKPPEWPAPILAFSEACTDRRLTEPLRQAIEALPTPSHGDGAAGGASGTGNHSLRLERSVELLDPTATGSAQNHLLRLRYRYVRPADPRQAADYPPIDRDVLILPTVAAWCP
ncbi:MAG: prepilin-type N-terminal cleavage/methylation domain-containing protein [Synechococcaceae cyanobacterium]|nr:prepilin-type N-terminal cleavage/methylation domain-containing protein [Synechococcaceae cyanobacterium]